MTGSADSPGVLAMFEAELGLVDIIARQVARSIGRHADLDELLSTGREGLLDAARKFEPERGSTFRAYANYRVFGAIIDGVRKMSGVPRRLHERLLAEHAAGLVAQERGVSSPRLDGVGDREVEEAFTDHLAALATAAALGAERPGDADLFESWGGDPEEAFARAELMARVREAMETLPVDDAEIIRMYYLEGRTLEQIATNMEISRSWACRLHGRAMERLAERLGARDR
jgi:RNA polymerase sigma factor for flagellar operon FliA